MSAVELKPEKPRARQNLSVDRSEATNVAAGSTLLGTGLVAAAIVIPLAAAAKPHPWTAVWFLVPICVAGVLASAGLYMLLAVYLGWPLPRTALEREMAAELHLEIHFERVVPSPPVGVLFQVGLLNDGGSDIANASMNVLLPSFVKTIHGSNHKGTTTRTIGVRTTPESIENDEHGDPLPSIYAAEVVDVLAGSALPIYYVAEFDQLRPFTVFVRLRASALGRTMALARAEFDPTQNP